MSKWDPQQFRREGELRGTASEILTAAEAIGAKIHNNNHNLIPLFTLRHLAHLTRVEYPYLREVVERKNTEPYEVFRIRKKGIDGFRIICAPKQPLLATQKWIAQNILRHTSTHTASYAFAPHKRIKDAAKLHCGSRWLIKMDVRRFFESISEIAVYRVFLKLGYEPLVSFELARICTRLGSNTRPRWRAQWKVNHRSQKIGPYQNLRLGHLPQGAPTSPMLSNLAMIGFDQAVATIAKGHGLIYSRYADDICFSTGDLRFDRQRASKVIGQVSAEMGKHGLSPNFTKTRVSPPGSRKIVLGLLVDGCEPKLSREFRSRLRQHVHYLTHPNYGPAEHAKKRKFASVEGLKNHVEGLIAYAQDIDSDYAADCRSRMKNVQWPFDSGSIDRAS